MDIKKIASTLGKLGGAKTMEKYGVNHFKKISQLGAEARKKKKIAKIDPV